MSSRQTDAVSTTIGPDVHTRLKGIVASSTEATVMVCIIGEEMRISKMFDVKLAPLETYAQGEARINLGHMSINKEFRGDLEAKSHRKY
jgi:hypothetical protein